jgi:hypothetical protein
MVGRVAVQQRMRHVDQVAGQHQQVRAAVGDDGRQPLQQVGDLAGPAHGMAAAAGEAAPQMQIRGVEDRYGGWHVSSRGRGRGGAGPSMVM